MPLGSSLLVLLVVVAVAVLAGASLKARSGRAAPGAGHVAGLADRSRFGERATLVQLSTPTCARCPGTARQLDAVAARHTGVTRLEVDLAERPELASRFDVAQTPTVLVVDAALNIRTRFGGPPRPAEVAEALAAVLEETARA